MPIAVPSVVRQELALLGVDSIVLMGGTGTVSASVERELERLLGG